MTKAGMSNEYEHYVAHYEDINVFSDPIYGYIPFIKRRESEAFEEDLIDSPWVQRMRRIHQLQSAWWVFPSAEHSRFQHAIGTMHLSGQFASHLYGFLEDIWEGEIVKLPSRPMLVETARVAGLLHDVGHGPFGHFFDEHCLIPKWGVNHEVIGEKVITSALKSIIESIRRSPEGLLRPDEQLIADDVAYIIKKPDAEDNVTKPEWLRLLRIIFSGIYTADNLDYVCRDAYMTGVCIDAVDISRLLYYTHIQRDPDDGKPVVTLHNHGIGALQRFLQTRFFMYDNIYTHRTVRAIEIDMEGVFEQTMRQLLRKNPQTDLQSYFKLDDWSLISRAIELARTNDRRLGEDWQRIIDRRPAWRMAFETKVQLDRLPSFLDMKDVEDRRARENSLANLICEQVSSATGSQLDQNYIRVDIVSLRLRPENPYTDENVVRIYDTVTGQITSEQWTRILSGIPHRSFIVRVYTSKDDYISEIARAATNILKESQSLSAFPTNI